MYVFKLEKAGFDVRRAKDGCEGLDLIEEHKPDLVLLDLDLPLMDGTDMLERLRATPWGKDIKVLILTNSTPVDLPDPIHAQPLSADRYIVKAHRTPAQILETIIETLRQSQHCC